VEYGADVTEEVPPVLCHEAKVSCFSAEAALPRGPSPDARVSPSLEDEDEANEEVYGAREINLQLALMCERETQPLPKPEKDADHPMEWIQVTAPPQEWGAAARGLIQRIGDRDLEVGQLVCVDAHHNSSEPKDCVLAACLVSHESSYKGARFKMGRLRFFSVQVQGVDWPAAHAEVSRRADGLGLRRQDIVSITGSHSKPGSGIIFCFYLKQAVPLHPSHPPAGSAVS